MPKRLLDPASKERQAQLKASATQVRPLEYTYVCDEGHWMSDSVIHEHCIAYVKGQRCTGTLTRVNKPSRGTQ